MNSRGLRHPHIIVCNYQTGPIGGPGCICRVVNYHEDDALAAKLQAAEARVAKLTEDIADARQSAADWFATADAASRAEIELRARVKELERADNSIDPSTVRASNDFQHCGCYTWTNGIGESGKYVCPSHAAPLSPHDMPCQLCGGPRLGDGRMGHTSTCVLLHDT